MNAYFFNITKEERENILDKHKEVYDGYVTQYVKPEVQELYVQDLANDKQGITVNNRGEVGVYRNMNINEMKHDGKDTGLFSNEAELDEQLDMIGDGPMDLENGTVDLDYDNILLGLKNRGWGDISHQRFNDFEKSDKFTRPKTEDEYIEQLSKFLHSDNHNDEDDFMKDYEDGWEGNPFDYMKDGGFFDDEDMFDEIDLEDDDFEELGIDDDVKKDTIVLNISESLDMFRRFSKYN
jgi:hypothetical protein